jgi:hypothetical protein
MSQPAALSGAMVFRSPTFDRADEAPSVSFAGGAGSSAVLLAEFAVVLLRLSAIAVLTTPLLVVWLTR